MTNSRSAPFFDELYITCTCHHYDVLIRVAKRHIICFCPTDENAVKIQCTHGRTFFVKDTVESIKRKIEEIPSKVRGE